MCGEERLCGRLHPSGSHLRGGAHGGGAHGGGAHGGDPRVGGAQICNHLLLAEHLLLLLTRLVLDLTQL